MANRPEELELHAESKKRLSVEPAPYPLIPPDYEITDKSIIQFTITNKNSALYYRDLFAHKLGVTRAEVYYLGLVDGYIWAACGFFVRQLMLRKQSRGNDGLVVQETFGLCVPCRYKRIVKLMLLCLSSRNFWDDLVEHYPVFGLIHGKVIFQTTCLSDGPDLKTHRTVTKLIERSQLPNGKFKLLYATEYRSDTYADCLQRWLKSDAKKASGPRLSEDTAGLPAGTLVKTRRAGPNLESPLER